MNPYGPRDQFGDAIFGGQMSNRPLPSGQHGGGGDEDEERPHRDELLDMVHEKRGITPGTELTGPHTRRPTRITHHEIKAMKVTVQKEDSPIVTIFRKIGGLFAGIFGTIMRILPSSSGHKKVDSCSLNGHVFPKTWAGEFPKCTHCGTTIKSVGEIKPK